MRGLYGVMGVSSLFKLENTTDVSTTGDPISTLGLTFYIYTLTEELQVVL